LPVPRQVVPAPAATVADPEPAVAQVVAAVPAPPAAGDGQILWGIPALLAVLLNSVLSHSRPRLWLISTLAAVRRSLPGLPGRPHVPVWLVRHAVRGLTLLRLTLGILRIW
jgi:hypothetical protein